MSISNNLLQGRFRGVPFLTAGVSTRGGRKNISYEFPNSDRRFIEDLGLFEKEFSFDVIVEGTQEDYFIQRDDLLDALDAPDAGLLEHPYLINGGILSVFVTSYTLNENDTSLGCAKFSIEFSVAESNIFPLNDDFSSNAVINQGDDVFNFAGRDIESTFKISNRTNFLIGESTLSFVLNSFDDNTRALVSTEAAINSYLSIFNNFNDNKSKSIADSNLLSTNLIDLFNAVETLGSTPREKFNLHTQFFDFGANFERVAPKTVLQRERLINNDLLLNNVNLLSLVNAYKNIIDIDFESIEDIEEQSNLAEKQFRTFIDFNYLDGKLEGNVGDFKEDTIDGLLKLRTTVRIALRKIRDELADIRIITLAGERSFLQQLYELYGDNFLEKYQTIININSLINTSLLPAGELKVIQES